jgi:hypothetical protein
MKATTKDVFIEKLNKVGEGIYKQSGGLSPEDCDYIYNFMYNKYNNPNTNVSVVPWDPSNSNVLYYKSIRDRRMIDIINKHKAELTDALREIHQEDIYPHLTTIVLWKPGQSMGRHVDNGSQTDHEDSLKMRKYTSVAYMNDDFVGGETFIRSDGQIEPNFRESYDFMFPNNVFTDYISKPKKGDVVLFGGDDRNAHGVTELKSGTRVILSIWFTTERLNQEPVL